MFPLIGILFNFLNSEIRNTYVPKNSDFRNPVHLHLYTGPECNNLGSLYLKQLMFLTLIDDVTAIFKFHDVNFFLNT